MKSRPWLRLLLTAALVAGCAATETAQVEPKQEQQQEQEARSRPELKQNQESQRESELEPEIVPEPPQDIRGTAQPGAASEPESTIAQAQTPSPEVEQSLRLGPERVPRRRISGLMIVDATFTERVVDRLPVTRLESFSIGNAREKARLVFWVTVRCVGPCRKKLAEKGELPLTMHWFADTGDTVSERAKISFSVKGESWRVWSSKGNLVPAIWSVVVKSDETPICAQMSGEDRCKFSIEVQK